MGKGYRDDDVPWRFSGRALYQLNLVKSSEARKHIPADLKLVELFGYTLGGVYLARYEDSPAGTFDEMVALGGLVWNPPTSCAWAARVFVNDASARAHGVKTCGLPSALARFDHDDGATDGTAGAAQKSASFGWWRNIKPPSLLVAAKSFASGGWREAKETKKNKQELLKKRETVRLRDGVTGGELCSIGLPSAGSGPLGPRINVKLPSFSGRTVECPDLLKYSLDLRANVRLSGPIALSRVDAEASKKGKGNGNGDEIENGKDAGGFWAPKGDVLFPPAFASASAASLSLAQSLPAIDTTNGDENAVTERVQKPPKSKPVDVSVMDTELSSILSGKPLLCVAFDEMEMDVGAPVKVMAK
jgi:hypothetical protein